jgi:hypothetical protein
MACDPYAANNGPGVFTKLNTCVVNNAKNYKTNPGTDGTFPSFLKTRQQKGGGSAWDQRRA